MDDNMKNGNNIDSNGKNIPSKENHRIKSKIHLYDGNRTMNNSSTSSESDCAR